MRRTLFLLCVCIVSVCLACGGGGGGSNNALPTSSPTASSTISPSPTATPSAQLNAVIDNGSVSLSWTRPATATSLQIEREKQGDAKAVVATPSLSTSSWVDTFAFEANALYRYTLTAFYLSSQIASATTDWVEPNDVPTWLIMYYYAMDNDLENFVAPGLNWLEYGLSFQPNATIVAEVDTKSASILGRITTQRILIKPDSNKPDNDPRKSELVSECVHDLGELDTSHPETLSDFISWSISNYTADKYMLILSDHGGQWRGFGEDKTNGIDLMKPEEVASAIKTALENSGLSKLDVFIYDACLMAGIEPLHPLRGIADNFVCNVTSSPAYPAYEAPIAFFLYNMSANPRLSSYDISSKIASDLIESINTIGNAHCINSHINLNYDEELINCINSFCSIMISKLNSSEISGFTVHHARSISFKPPVGEKNAFLCNIIDFLKHLKGFVENNDVINAISNLENALDSLVISTYITNNYLEINEKSISIMLPDQDEWQDYKTMYRQSSFAVQTLWDEFIDAYIGESGNSPILTMLTESPVYIRTDQSIPIDVSVNIASNEPFGIDDISHIQITVLTESQVLENKLFIYGALNYKGYAGDNSVTIQPSWYTIGDGENTYWLPLIPLSDNITYATPVYYYDWWLGGGDYYRDNNGDPITYLLLSQFNDSGLQIIGVFESDLSGQLYCHSWDEIDILYMYLDLENGDISVTSGHRLDMGIIGEVTTFTILFQSWFGTVGQVSALMAAAFDYAGNRSNNEVVALITQASNKVSKKEYSHCDGSANQPSPASDQLKTMLRFMRKE